MSDVITFPPQLRAVPSSPEPPREPALVLAIPVRLVPVERCESCGVAHPTDLHDLNGGPDIPA
jgi:hypothetical protein